ncbi:hypothetical protein GCM10009808_06880 [Microbacterium sediminicola]|uniref:Uncharacterized protein n=1 Tax=Microbacterium sediminicola TaxID=415210 RepID=A0ABN2HRU9_9MICO
MTGTTPDPHTRVEIELNLGSPEYVVTATSLYGDDSSPWWESLGNLLYGRPGWYCELANTDGGAELMWSFGALGSSLFNISLTDDPTSFQLFDYAADECVLLSSIDELREWLDRNEARHATHVERNLAPMASANGWRLLKAHEFMLDLTYDEATWIASVRKLPVTAAFGSSLKEAVSNAREAIAHAFHAPPELAADIRVSVRLDQAAVAAL